MQGNSFPVCDELVGGLDWRAEIHKYVQHEECVNSPDQAIEVRRAEVVVRDSEGRLSIAIKRRPGSTSTLKSQKGKSVVERMNKEETVDYEHVDFDYKLTCGLDCKLYRVTMSSPAASRGPTAFI